MLVAGEISVSEEINSHALTRSIEKISNSNLYAMAETEIPNLIFFFDHVIECESKNN